MIVVRNQINEGYLLVRKRLNHSIPDKIVVNVRISKRPHPVVRVLEE